MAASKVYTTPPSGYTPSPTPQTKDLGTILTWIVTNFRLISTALNRTLLMAPQAASKAPETLQDGMVRLARAPWHPVASQTADAWVYYDATTSTWQYFTTSS